VNRKADFLLNELIRITNRIANWNALPDGADGDTDGCDSFIEPASRALSVMHKQRETREGAKI